jgi:predicted ATPase
LRLSFPHIAHTPAFHTELVGREPELADLVEFLSRGAAPVILVGPPGVGKSRLAWETVRELTRRDVVASCHAVDVAAHHDIDSVMSVMAASLRTDRTAAERRDAVPDLMETLIGRPACALFFDNAERLAADVAAVAAQIVASVPDCRIIVTTRQATPSGSCRVVRLLPMTIESAARLFAARAEQQTGGRNFDSTSEPLRQLVAALDGLPLAVELAASRSRVLSVHQMHTMLEQRLRLLRSNDPRRANDRQATLEGTLDWSWEMLDSWERNVLTQIAVFAGPFSLDDAENVIDAGPAGSWTIDILQNLYDRSLIYVRQPEGDVAVQYGMYQGIRDYVFKRADGHSLAHARARYSAWYTAEAGRWASRFDHIGEQLILDWFERQRPHVLQVIEDGIRTRPAAAADMMAEIDIVLAVREPFELVLALYRRILDALPPDDHGRRSRLLRSCGHELLLRGRLSEGSQFVEQAIALMPSTLSAHERSRFRLTEGVLRMRQCRYADSRDILLSVRRDGSMTVHSADLSRTFLYLGMLYSAWAENDIANRQEHLQQALVWYQQALEVSTQIQAHRFQAAVCANIGNVYQRLDMRAEQRLYYTRALEQACTVGHRMLEGMALANLAWVALLDNDLRSAAALLDQSLPLQRLVRRFNAEGLVHQRRGIIDALRGQWGAASSSLLLAAELYERSNEYWLHIDTMVLLGVCRIGAGRPEEARQHGLLARQCAAAASDEPRETMALWLLAASQAMTEDREFADTLELAQQRPMPRHGASAPQLVSMFRALIEAGRSGPHRDLQSARQRLLDLTGGFPLGDRITSLLPDVRVAAYIVDHMLAIRDRQFTETVMTTGDAQGDSDDLPGVRNLRVGEGSAWFALDDQEPIELSRRRIVRSLFSALLKARLEEPTRPVSVQQLVDAAWPGQKFIADSGANRVYVAIASLRSLGLGEILQTRTGGYLFDPHVPICMESGP